MIENERKLYEQRIDIFIKRLKHLFYENERPVNAEYCKSNPVKSFEQRTDGHYKSITVGDSWGKDWERAWFHLQAIIPNEWKGKQVVARLNLGGESLIFDSDGTPLQSLSVHTIWGGQCDFKRDRYLLTESANGGEKIDLWIEATAGQLFGLELEDELAISSPTVFGKYEAAVSDLVIAIFREDIRQLYLDCLVLNDQMKALPLKSVRRQRILHAFMNAINCFMGDPDTVEQARAVLKPEMEKKSNASDLTTAAIGHAHLDTAWLWPIHETIRKCARTFSNQIANIEKYPDYIFGASMAQHYAFVKEYYPKLYEKIKQKIKTGRWEVLGAMWVEADCNLPGGESLVRQILLGKLFFKNEFGLDIKNLWLPDVFGYSAALPQILKKSGIDYFVTQKISWNQFNRFPYHTFLWRGIDGSEIISHFPPEDNYNSTLLPSTLMKAQENFDENYFLDEFLTLFGIGDGGGGANEDIIETGLRLKNMEACPGIRFSKAQDFLDRLNEKTGQLPAWVGELYFELHRGTLTTHAYNKKMNRFMEQKLRELEILYSTLPYNNYPAQQLDHIWKIVLLNQFHDIIPGSSVTPVYEDSRKQYNELVQQTNELTTSVGELLFRKDNRSICLVNTLSYSYKKPVVLPDCWYGYSMVDASNTPVNIQYENDKAVIQTTIPPLAAKTLKLSAKVELPEPALLPKEIMLENDLIRYEFSETGAICRIYDKRLQKEILTPDGMGNVLTLYEDRPANYDAWDIDIYYENQQIARAKLESQNWIAQGLVRQGIQQQYSIGNSKIIQKLFLAANSKRLDFETDVDWQEEHKMLRVSFAVNISFDTASYEIQYGYLKRNTHRNTSWDMAKFEVAGHRYADLSDITYGVALLNDCKYGYKISGNSIDLNLLRATTMPDSKADKGKHHFTYSILPHQGNLIESDVLSEAAQLNQPVACFPGYRDNGMKIPYQLDTEDIVIEVIKKAEQEDAQILRLYEPKGKSCTAKLTIEKLNIRVFETDLMENNLKMLTFADNIVDLEFKPFEIKTLKIIDL